MSLPDWAHSFDGEIFWGSDNPTPEMIEARLAEQDVVWHYDDTILLMQYDRVSMSAWIHGRLAPEHRKFGFVKAAIEMMCDRAKNDGMRKIIAQVMEGNPFLRTNRKSIFGFDYVGRLKRHFFIGGQWRDICFFERFLQDVAPKVEPNEKE